MEALYADGRYLAQNPTWHVEDSAWKAEQVRALLADEGLAPATIAEVGCGAGEILRRLHDALPAARLEGWDVSPQALALCRERASARLVFRCGDLAAERAAHYELLLCLDVVEHVPDYLGFLRALRERARWKLFHLPLDLSVWNVLRGAPARLRRSVGHLHCFDAETALAALAECGYRVRATRYTRGSLELPPRTALRRAARLPRRVLAGVHTGLAARLLGGFSLLVLAE